MHRHGNPSVTQFWRECKHVVKWKKVSCDRLKHKEARLQLFAWAYNLANPAGSWFYDGQFVAGT